jgi:hypothetical protein
LLLGLCLSNGCQVAERQSIPAELFGVTKTTTVIEAFRPMPEFDRHDPPNICIGVTETAPKAIVR